MDTMNGRLTEMELKIKQILMSKAARASSFIIAAPARLSVKEGTE